LQLANHFNISNPKQIIAEVKDILTNFSHYAKLLDIRKQETKLIEKTIQGTL